MKSVGVAALVAAGGAAEIFEAIGATGAGAYTGFTITYYGTFASGVATGLEATTVFFWTANAFSDFCCKTFS